jgi:hypothetical protein
MSFVTPQVLATLLLGEGSNAILLKREKAVPRGRSKSLTEAMKSSAAAVAAAVRLRRKSDPGPQMSEEELARIICEDKTEIWRSTKVQLAPKPGASGAKNALKAAENDKRGVEWARYDAEEACQACTQPICKTDLKILRDANPAGCKSCGMQILQRIQRRNKKKTNRGECQTLQSANLQRRIQFRAKTDSVFRISKNRCFLD